MTTVPRRLIVALTGASGVTYGIRTLELLRELGGIESHLVISPAALRTVVEETDDDPVRIRGLAHVVHDYRDIGASIASGSFRTMGMLVAPCSVRTLSGIAHASSDDLIIRAADVCLKERRRVVLLFRETPLHAGHIALMERATLSGAVIMPPVPAFYARPHTIDDIVVQTIGRALDLFGIDLPQTVRWREKPPASA